MPDKAERRAGQPDVPGSGSGHGIADATVNHPADIPPGLSDERDWWLRRLLAAERAAWLAGYEAGNADGYAYGTRQMEATWPPIVKGLNGPSLAELELLRWGPGGRERFGDPRRGDRFPKAVAR